MGEVIYISTRKPKSQKLEVIHSDRVCIIDLYDIEDLATGKIKASQYKDPDDLTRNLAMLILSYAEIEI